VVLLGTCATGCLMLAMPLNAWTFALGATAFAGGWMASGVAQYAMLAGFDRVGRHIALIPACVGFGSALGSSAGGYVIEASGFAMAYAMAAFFATASMLVASRSDTQRHATGATHLPAAQR
jgi:predicted MFS family arabinose efflux permease